MLPKMQASRFVKKHSVQFVNSRGKESAPFYFWDNTPHECSQTWQVVRSEFDQVMLNNAHAHGVQAFEGARVHAVLFGPSTSRGTGPSTSRGADAAAPVAGRTVGVAVKMGDEPTPEVRAQVVVDASGLIGPALQSSDARGTR